MEKLDKSGQVFDIEPLRKPENSMFDDVDFSRWSYDAIKFATEKKLLIGKKTKEGHIFDPNQPVTREELAVALFKFWEIIIDKM